MNRRRPSRFISGTTRPVFTPTPASRAEINDCVIQSLVAATGCGYDDAHDVARAVGRRRGEGVRLTRILGTRRVGRVVLGHLFRQIKRDCGGRTFATLGTFVRCHPVGVYIVKVNSHALVLRDGILIDSAAQTKRLGMVYRVWQVTEVAP